MNREYFCLKKKHQNKVKSLTVLRTKNPEVFVIYSLGKSILVAPIPSFFSKIKVLQSILTILVRMHVKIELLPTCVGEITAIDTL